MSLMVIDASVALKWVCEEAGSETAATFLDGRPLAAPSLWLTEAANALWKLAQRKILTPDEAEERLSFLVGAPVRLIDTVSLLPAALRIARTLEHPVYDCVYLATAMHLSAKVVTADKRFYETAKTHPLYAETVMALHLMGTSSS
ncbi:type II toxin-antitoxin system VapC family toxin [Nitrospirillum iridis]|uniref:Ribonuclease VapC n=1 Tax=Nitrospirillum iridis TaxID=765888 RepID=A0A7X0B2T6_9PROT|nr:type II toxin-antitoxin system VapC family toxin [Nitrospirillum iridis]MBB6254342.1 putative nucleic acid-binding protein [Nitrospirillum iridis]